jgi:hypothetical protein
MKNIATRLNLMGIIVAVSIMILIIASVSAYSKEVFLSDMTPKSSFIHGPLRIDEDYYGETIKMDGKEYERGIVTHVEAPQGYSEVIYEVGGYKTFRAEIGLSHRDAPPAGSVIFFVYIDNGKGGWIEKYKSDVIKHENPTIPLELDISGAKELRLYCTDAGDGINSDHGTWANARVDTASIMAVKTQRKIIKNWASIKSL